MYLFPLKFSKRFENTARSRMFCKIFILCNLKGPGNRTDCALNLGKKVK